MLGVFDRKTGSLKVAPIKGNRVLRMEPRARTLNYGAPTETPQPQPETDMANAVAKRRESNARLVEEFGSQRRKRQLAASRAAQVNASQISAGEQILEMIASSQGVDIGTREAVVAASLAQRNIPPHHPEATKPEDAYRMEEIIPPSISDALEIRKLFPAESKSEYREELLKAKTFGQGYVLSRLGVLTTPDADQREARARCLVLLGHLLKLYARAGGVIKSQPEAGGISTVADRLQMAPSVLEGILSMFYTVEGGFDGDRYLLSKEKHNLMLGWILVLAVRAERECVLEPASFLALAEELKMRGTDVAAHFRELGCTTSRSSASGVGRGSTGVRVALLPPGNDGKTLGESFPALKLGGRKPGAAR